MHRDEILIFLSRAVCSFGVPFEKLIQALIVHFQTVQYVYSARGDAYSLPNANFLGYQDYIKTCYACCFKQGFHVCVMIAPDKR